MLNKVSSSYVDYKTVWQQLLKVISYSGRFLGIASYFTRCSTESHSSLLLSWHIGI